VYGDYINWISFINKFLGCFVIPEKKKKICSRLSLRERKSVSPSHFYLVEGCQRLCMWSSFDLA